MNPALLAKAERVTEIATQIKQLEEQKPAGRKKVKRPAKTAAASAIIAKTCNAAPPQEPAANMMIESLSLVTSTTP